MMENQKDTVDLFLESGCNPAALTPEQAMEILDIAEGRKSDNRLDFSLPPKPDDFTKMRLEQLLWALKKVANQM